MTISGRSVSLVWDAKNDVIYKEPVLTNDTDYQAWYAKQKVLTSTNMFPSYTHCGRTVYDVNALPWDSVVTTGAPHHPITTSYVERPSLCTILSPGLKDSHSYVDDKTVFTHDPAEPHSHWVQYAHTYNYFTIPSLSTTIGLPVSAFYPCVIPSAFNPGINVSYYSVDHTLDEYAIIGGFWQTWNMTRDYRNDITYTFPYGLPLAYSYTSSWAIMTAGVVDTDPNLKLRVYPANVNTRMIGKYTNRIIANACIAQHQVRQEIPGWTYYEIGHELKIYAQTLFDNDDNVTSVNWVAEGGNATLEGKIKEATDMLFVLNGDKYAYCSITIEIL